MKTEWIRFALGFVLLSAITACHDDDEAGGPPDAGAPQTLKEFAVADLGTRTTPTGAPQELNELVLDTTDEDPAQFDDLLESP